MKNEQATKFARFLYRNTALALLVPAMGLAQSSRPAPTPGSSPDATVTASDGLPPASVQQDAPAPASAINFDDLFNTSAIFSPKPRVFTFDPNVITVANLAPVGSVTDFRSPFDAYIGKFQPDTSVWVHGDLPPTPVVERASLLHHTEYLALILMGPSYHFLPPHYVAPDANGKVNNQNWGLGAEFLGPRFGWGLFEYDTSFYDKNGKPRRGVGLIADLGQTFTFGKVTFRPSAIFGVASAYDKAQDILRPFIASGEVTALFKCPMFLRESSEKHGFEGCMLGPTVFVQPGTADAPTAVNFAVKLQWVIVKAEVPHPHPHHSLFGKGAQHPPLP